jgi:exopolysaccharide biosynthesis polyprenyl glycosylphosphotransferase
MDIMIEHDNIQWKIVPSLFNLVIDPVTFDEFKDYPIINVSPSKKNKSHFLIKRIMDISLSGIALLMLSPLFFFVALMIQLTMPGPVFFRQERLGKDLKPFRLFKFRSMVVDADKMKDNLENKNEVKGLFKMKDDPRITPFGKFLRRSCIDELPQIINIFIGDMSIVGPRPHLQRELGNFEGWRRARFKVKPGLTGMWQVNGRHELNFDKAVLYDIYYIRHQSIIIDIGIILKTIPSILMSRGRF